MKFIREPIIDSSGKLTGFLPFANKDAFIPRSPQQQLHSLRSQLFDPAKGFPFQNCNVGRSNFGDSKKYFYITPKRTNKPFQTQNHPKYSLLRPFEVSLKTHH